jgi:8-oxo-dGTP diphosphatase
MKEYVLIFAFSHNRERVLLIHKQKPLWQRARFNGVGGKLEKKDFEQGLFCTPHQFACSREFLEETGIGINPGDFEYFATIHNRDGSRVLVFRVFDTYIEHAKTTTDEEVKTFHVYEVLTRQLPLIENLPWLIALALDPDKPIATVSYK